MKPQSLHSYLDELLKTNKIERWELKDKNTYQIISEQAGQIAFDLAGELEGLGNFIYVDKNKVTFSLKDNQSHTG